MRFRSPEGDTVIRTLAAVLLVAVASGTAAAYDETHLNEITAPVASYVTDRIAVLAALASPTAAQKKELSALEKLAKKLAKTQFVLKGDFAELAAAGKTYDKLGTAGTPMQPALDEAFLRAGLSLSERVELAGDHAELLAAKHLAAVQKALATAATERGRAAQSLSAGGRAKSLAAADAAASSALKKGEKFVVADRGAPLLPPTRYRSGDAISGGGGRVAVPRDSASPIAGASIVIPDGLLQNAVSVTLAAAPSFAGGRDVPAGPAVAVGPDGLALAAAATVYVPYQVPPGATALDLGLLALGPPPLVIATVTPRADGTLAADVASFSTFQAAVPAPPRGQPGGAYHLQMFSINTALDASGQDAGGVLAGVIDQTITFRLDHTGSTAPPSFPALTRTFVGAAPHHLDEALNPFLGSVDFAWTSGGAGRFAFDLPLASGTVAQSSGAASDDGRVIVFSGRGGTFEFLAVGVKGTGAAVTADLAGRWVAVETGVRFLDDAAEPFRTRWFGALRTFTADADGAVTFDGTGERQETDVTYHTDQADPVHTRAANVLADSGAETWAVGAGDRVTGAQSTRFGWFDEDAGFLVTAVYDATARSVSLMVAVPQPAQADTAALAGLYRFAEIEAGTSTGTPSAATSAHDVTPATGTLDVASATAATLSTDAAARAAYTLAGAPPLSDITWSLTSASTLLAASAAGVTLSLDAAGTHRPPADERWFAFSGDGRYVLGLTRGEPTRLARGISVGVK